MPRLATFSSLKDMTCELFWHPNWLIPQLEDASRAPTILAAAQVAVSSLDNMVVVGVLLELADAGQALPDFSPPVTQSMAAGLKQLLALTVAEELMAQTVIREECQRRLNS